MTEIPTNRSSVAEMTLHITTRLSPLGHEFESNVAHLPGTVEFESDVGQLPGTDCWSVVFRRVLWLSLTS